MTPDDSLVRRMKGAATFDVAVYEEVEADPGATVQALGIVAIAAVAQAIGSLDTGLLEMTRAALGAVIGWLVFAGLAFLVGTKLFHGDATWGEVLRTIGFAQVPALLAVLSSLPLLGWLVDTVVVLWVLWASVIALRQALDIDTLRAVVTGILAGGVWAFLSFVL